MTKLLMAVLTAVSFGAMAADAPKAVEPAKAAETVKDSGKKPVSHKAGKHSKHVKAAQPATPSAPPAAAPAPAGK